ncbi:Holliday junction DNA helicase subunit RuvA [Halopolyspora algeriensis]|uniref:Holliday junction branch migration complex subunit RuvA n=1 Tax=Halopolyspora algeriensis TaxID=1500506 RepID=A0A368VQH7_9ACTN|nr:Holliday junction branch migration protein RuvA [Halopolyspora algeriensis]RCW43910.1 Holliday junction DNA helicase subunit RuvA [Halopolyspora algeriensis]TQM53587.1 Holliday junction DNA helicase subunit RuvA [Halopolyspora algeriensis]
MIASVRGTVLSVSLDHAVVEVGGVGFAVYATPATLAGLRRGEETHLATSLVVREDSLTLYGFATAEAQELFGLLQSASGVGPRLALATLAVLDPEQLRHALADGNLTLLTQVPGIGKKSAERLTLELRDKVGAPGGSVPENGQIGAAGGGRLRSEVCDALVGLGFSAKQAEQSVESVLAADGTETDTSAVLRKALAKLGPQ